MTSPRPSPTPTRRSLTTGMMTRMAHGSPRRRAGALALATLQGCDSVQCWYAMQCALLLGNFAANLKGSACCENSWIVTSFLQHLVTRSLSQCADPQPRVQGGVEPQDDRQSRLQGASTPAASVRDGIGLPRPCPQRGQRPSLYSSQANTAKPQRGSNPSSMSLPPRRPSLCCSAHHAALAAWL